MKNEISEFKEVRWPFLRTTLFFYRSTSEVGHVTSSKRHKDSSKDWKWKQLFWHSDSCQTAGKHKHTYTKYPFFIAVPEKFNIEIGFCVCVFVNFVYIATSLKNDRYKSQDSRVSPVTSVDNDLQILLLMILVCLHNTYAIPVFPIADFSNLNTSTISDR